MSPDLAMTDSGVRRFGRGARSMWQRGKGLVLSMAPRKKNGDIDKTATAWRGFVTAMLGMLTALVWYVAAYISNLPPPGSASKAEMKQFNQRLTALEDGQEITRETIQRIDRKITKFIDGVNGVTPAVKTEK
jgi:hypothetical protein